MEGPGFFVDFFIVIFYGVKEIVEVKDRWLRDDIKSRRNDIKRWKAKPIAVNGLSVGMTSFLGLSGGLGHRCLGMSWDSRVSRRVEW